MNVAAFTSRCAFAGIVAGREIRDRVHAMPLADRGRTCTSILKPKGNKKADAVAESVGLRHLERLARELGCPVKLLTDTAGGSPTIGRDSGAVVWVSFDAVDGTVKLAGLGNDLRRGRIRAANDGAWAPVMAFTLPTDKQASDLCPGDFVAAAVVDGNPVRYRTYPQEIITVADAGGRPVTYELANRRKRRLFTSTGTDLSHSFVFLDAFQAYDRDTRRVGDEALAIELYRRLINRHAGGAYDVLRHFGSLSALQRVMLGWRAGSTWYEAQGVAFIAVNENLPNLIPAVSVMSGAGALCVDFEDRALAARRLSAGRTSVVYAANPTVRRTVMNLVRAARDAAGH